MLDYLSFTIRNDIVNSFDVVSKELKKFLDIDFSILEIKNGLHYYAKRWTSEEITILFGGQEGIHVQLSGVQLNNLGDKKVLDILKYIDRNDLKVTRIDLCLDFEKEFSYFLKKVRKGDFKSNSKNISYILNQHDKGTIYIGSRTSSVFTRIYDKGLEQKIDKIWTRLEVQLKKEKCTKRIIKLLVNNDISGLKHVINGVIHMTSGVNKNFCKIYYDLVNTAKIIKIKTCAFHSSLTFMQYGINT